MTRPPIIRKTTPAIIAVVAVVAVALYLTWQFADRGHVLPALPILMLDEFSAPVQEQILTAQSELQNTPEDAVSNLRLGMILHAYKLLPPAIACYQRARLLEPGDYRTSYLLGIAQAQAGDDSSAIRHLREALELNPAYQSARLRLAERLLKTGRLGEARELFETILQETPDEPWAQHGQGQVHAALGDQAAAIAHYEEAVSLFEPFGPAHYALALAYRDQGDTAQAERHLDLYRRYQKQTPPHADPLLQSLDELDVSARAAIRRAQRLEKSGRVVDALLALEQAVEIDPESVEAHGQLVRLYHLFNDFDKAEQHYRAAVAIQPGDVLAGLQYGLFLGEQDRYADAVAVFEQVLAANSDHAEAHTYLAQALEQTGHPREAEAHYRKALASDPNKRQVNFLLGRRLLTDGQAAEAEPYLEKAAAPDDEQTAFYLYHIALAYNTAGRKAQAEAYLRRAREAASAGGQPPLLDEIMQTEKQWRGSGQQ